MGEFLANEWVSLLLTTFSVVFALVDPLGYIPIFVSMTSGDTDERREAIVRRACIASFAFLVLATLMGKHLLSFFGISIPALQISGGLILLAIGFEMLKVAPVAEKITPHEENEALRKDDISIVPLAFPMLAGPGSIATVIVLTSKNPSYMNYSAILVSVFVTLLITYFALRFAPRILGFLGVTGVNVLTRIMGLLLSAMAIQFIINGYLAVR